jgi:hypothetical protein
MKPRMCGKVQRGLNKWEGKISRKATEAQRGKEKKEIKGLSPSPSSPLSSFAPLRLCVR